MKSKTKMTLKIWKLTKRQMKTWTSTNVFIQIQSKKLKQIVRHHPTAKAKTQNPRYPKQSQNLWMISPCHKIQTKVSSDHVTEFQLNSQVLMMKQMIHQEVDGLLLLMKIC